MAADTFQLKRGTTAAVNAYLPAVGEPVYDTTLKRLKVGDGVTLGGTDPSLSNANLSALADLTGAADRLAYFTGVGAMALTPLTAVARALLDDTTVAAQRTTLGLGTVATSDVTTSAIDTTAGRILKVGDFGVGATVAPAAASVDALRFWASQQIASALATASGLPLNVGHMVTTMPGVGGTSAHQFASPLTSGASNKNRLWHRQCFSDVWTAWEEFAYGGANSSITSLTGLTTALSIAQGGTGNTSGLAATATALATSRSISATGDATWTVNFNGTANATAAITLANTGVGAGTYGAVTVNAKGLVTAASTATPIANGGTGSTTAAAARAALGVLDLGTDYISGLQLVRVSGTALTVTSGGAYLVGASSVLQVSADIVLSGLSLTASTLYHVYLYSNAGTPAVEVVTTAPSTVYRGKARTKTGDTSRRYLGSVYVLSAGGMAPFVHDLSSGKIMYLEAAFGGPLMVVNGGQATAVTNVTSAALPSTATAVDILAVNAATTTGVLNIGATGFAAYQALAVTQRGWLSVPLNSSNQISYNYDVTPTGGAQPAAFITVCAYSFGR